MIFKTKATYLACLAIFTSQIAVAADVEVGSDAIYRIEGNNDSSQPIEPGNLEGVIITSNGNQSGTSVSGAEAYITVLSEDQTQGGASDYGYVNIGADQINLDGNTSISGALSTTGNTSIGGDLSVAGSSTLTGATQINSTLGVTGTSTLASINRGCPRFCVNGG